MAPASRQRRAVGYVRVSRVNGRSGDSFISPDVQRETIERVAAAKGLRIVGWFTDLDQSGGKYDRPGFQDALETIERGDAELLVVAKLTRFARSTVVASQAIARLHSAGAGVIFCDLDIDTTTPIGKAVQAILTAIAELELDAARESWQVARSVAAANGKFPGRLPLGYRRARDQRVEVDPVIGPAVAELFRGRSEGLAFSVLAERFTAQTGRALHPQSVDRVLENRAYLGQLRNGELELDVTPLVTPAEFAAAQLAKAPRPARSATGSLLAGILRCGSCGQPMSFRGGKGGQYTCQRFANGEQCTAPVLIAGAKIDEHVERVFLARHRDRHAHRVAGPDFAELADAELELERRKADLAATLSLDLGAAGDVLLASIADKTAAVERQTILVEDLRGRLDLEERLESIDERWPELELDQRRRLLSRAIASVTVHRVGPGARVPIEERAAIEFAGGPAATSPADPARA